MSLSDPDREIASDPSNRASRGATGTQRVDMKALNGTISPDALRAYHASRSSGCIRNGALPWTTTGRSVAPMAKSLTSRPAKIVASIPFTSFRLSPSASARWASMSSRSAASSASPWLCTFDRRGSAFAAISSACAVSRSAS